MLYAHRHRRTQRRGEEGKEENRTNARKYKIKKISKQKHNPMDQAPVNSMQSQKRALRINLLDGSDCRSQTRTDLSSLHEAGQERHRSDTHHKYKIRKTKQNAAALGRVPSRLPVLLKQSDQTVLE